MIIKIRKAGPEDTDSILEIERCCFEYPWSRVLFEADLNSNPNALYLIAEGFDDENSAAAKPLGFIGTHNIAGEINITNVAVRPEARQHKIGSKLVAYMIQYFDSLSDADGFVGITLEVDVENTPAIKLYEKFGFKTEGVRKHYYKNGNDALIMWIRK